MFFPDNLKVKEADAQHEFDHKFDIHKKPLYINKEEECQVVISGVSILAMIWSFLVLYN